MSMDKANLVVINNESKAKELVGRLCAHGATVIKTTSAIIVLTLIPELLNAATKEEVRLFLENHASLAPGQKDSIQYTDQAFWELAYGDMYQNDGQSVKLFSGEYEIPFNSS